MKKKIKGIVFLAAAAVILVGGSTLTALAGSQSLTYSSSTSGNGNKITVSNVELDSDNDEYANEIELNFSTRVTFKNTAKVSAVTDNNGVSYTGTITDKDSDELDIYIKNLKKGRTYTIKITGIKKAGTSQYRTLTVKVKVPASTASTTLKVKEVSCDMDDDGDNESDSVSFEFNKDVTFKSSAYVIIKDSNGKQITTKSTYIEEDDDECEVDVNASLKQGKKYTYTIAGVKVKGTSTYKTLTGSFTAYED